MLGAHDFLEALAIVLGVAAVTTVVFQRLRQPVVLGYLIAGLIVGPHVPVPLVADAGIVHALSELGVIVLMFSLGLEFSLRRLVAVASVAGVIAVIQCSLMMWLGFVVGRAFGWTTLESIFTGAIIAISSTTIIAKAFDEQKVGGRLRELVVGVLIVEDLIAVLLMAGLTAVASGGGVSASELGLEVGRLAGFLVGLVVVGMLTVPRAMRAIVRLERPETTIVASLGLCFGVALLAYELGYSVALGAFIAGSLVAESGEAKTVEHLVQPVRDVFAAVFFVSVGMLMEPALIAEHWLAVVVLVVVVVAGKLVGVTVGAFFTGNGVRTSVQAGMSLAQIGEFSFIIAGLGLSLGATGSFLYPVAVAVSAATTLSTPWLIRAAGPTANWVDRKLPRPLQTFAALYGSWVERVRATSPPGRRAAVRRLLGLLGLDTALLAALLVGVAVGRHDLATAIAGSIGVAPATAEVLVLVGLVVVSSPFLVGIVRVAGRLGAELAERALPPGQRDAPDLAAAPRRAFVVALQLGIVGVVGLPLLALTQPLMPGFWIAIGFASVLAALAISFWRGAADLSGHVRAGVEVIVEALAAQSASPEPGAHEPTLAEVQTLLPGLGEPVPLRLAPGCPGLGQSLARLDLRGLTGATVLAIVRDGAGFVPTATEVLRAGDLVVLAGTEPAIAAARALLTAPAAAPAPPAPPAPPAVSDA